MNPNMMNRNVSYYGANRNRMSNCDKSCGNMPASEMNQGTNCACMKHENMRCGKYVETDCQQLEGMNQQQLLTYLNQVSFSMYDTTLFLDTHPCDREAMAYFKEMQHARKHALDMYQKKFGPLLLDDVDADCEWTWGMQPLPWEPMC